MQAAEARPPYVTFELRAVEDREASIKAGHYVARDIAMAFITPQGSKDRNERYADDWFENLTQQVAEGRFPQEWLSRYKAEYKAWKEGVDIPLHGTSILNWPAVTPAQVKTLQQARVLTIEDLAAANEETLGRLGMGGRSLKQRAVEWLSASSNTGRIAEETAALKVANEELKATNTALLTRLEKLEAAQTAQKTTK